MIIEEDEDVHIYIIYAHPSKKSFTFQVLHSFCDGLKAAGHTYEISDLYAMDFQPELDEDQYNREIDWDRPESPVPPDVREQQERVNRADGLAFVYPVWWSDCPAKLKGWFDRVWSYGFAYFYEGQTVRKSCLKPTRALALCPAGHTLEDLTETGIAQSMSRIMLHDRLHNVGIQEAHLEILGGMTGAGEDQRQKNLARAFELGKNYFSPLL